MNEQTLISDEILAEVLEECQRVGQRVQGGRVFRHEPLLQQFVQDQLLATIGRLVLEGASGEVTRQVASDIDRLVILSVAAVQRGYRGLLLDLMPNETRIEAGGAAQQESKT